ncbi:MAG: hypothetical protein RMK80_08440 [Pseudobdellovibrionaceae bacterium]|nr:hypothetical protein [Pseudobdellovibrionaceae bacterium]
MESSKGGFFQRSYLKPLFVDIRCPECEKLYRLDTRDLISDSPHFDCIVCKTTFTVTPDPQSPRNLISKSVYKQIKYQLIDLDTINTEAVKLCPKCHKINPKKSSECLHCGIIFVKWERAQRGTGLLPGLIKAWEDLMNDYDNMMKHLAFVGQCEELQALPLALKKYEELKALQPSDPIANKMYQKLVFKIINHEKVTTKPWVSFLFRKTIWIQFFQILSWGLPIVFIIIGLLTPGLRNIIGFGSAWLFLRAAIYFFWRRS